MDIDRCIVDDNEMQELNDKMIQKLVMFIELWYDDLISLYNKTTVSLKFVYCVLFSI